MQSDVVFMTVLLQAFSLETISCVPVLGEQAFWVGAPAVFAGAQERGGLTASAPEWRGGDTSAEVCREHSTLCATDIGPRPSPCGSFTNPIQKGPHRAAERELQTAYACACA